MIKSFALCILVIVLMACKTTEFKNAEKNDNCKPLVQDANLYEATSDPFTIVSAVVNEKYLKVEIEYSGGCGDAEFSLVWNGSMMKSMPPQIPMKIHLVDKDNCRSVVQKSLCFEINQVYDGDFIILLKDFDGELIYSKKK